MNWACIRARLGFSRLAGGHGLPGAARGRRRRLVRQHPGRLAVSRCEQPAVLGRDLEDADARLFRFWQHLPEALTTGQPQNEARHGEANLFEELYRDERGLEGFLDAMTGFSRLNFELFAERFDFSRFRTLTDIGGATGLLSIEVAKRHPHMECISFDLPQVEPVARKAVAKAGLDGRVQLVSGDSSAIPCRRRKC